MSMDTGFEVPLELATERDTLVERARAHEVTDARSYNDAGGLLRAIKALGTQITAAFAEPIRLAHEAHKASLRARDKYLKPVQEAERTVKGHMADWQRTEERKRGAEEAWLQQEAQAKAEEARLVEAIKLQAEGKQEAAEALVPDEKKIGGTVRSMGQRHISAVPGAQSVRVRPGPVRRYNDGKIKSWRTRVS